MVEAYKVTDSDPEKVTVTLPNMMIGESIMEALSPQQRRVFDCLVSNDCIMRPYEIGQMINIDRKTVASRLSELRKLHLVSWKKGGYYEISPLQKTLKETHSVSFGVFGGLPRLQNVRLSACAVVSVYDLVVCDFGVWGLRIEFGSTNGLVGVVLGCDLGFDPVGFDAALRVIESLCADRGFCDLNWRVSSFEWVNDFYGLRLDGVSAVTLRDFLGNFTKIYQKPWGVRRESRVNGSLSLDDVWALLRGNVHERAYSAEVSRLAAEMEGYRVAQKYMNRQMADFGQQLAGIRRILEASP